MMTHFETNHSPYISRFFVKNKQKSINKRTRQIILFQQSISFIWILVQLFLSCFGLKMFNWTFLTRTLTLHTDKSSISPQEGNCSNAPGKSPIHLISGMVDLLKGGFDDLHVITLQPGYCFRLCTAEMEYFCSTCLLSCHGDAVVGLWQITLWQVF